MQLEQLRKKINKIDTEIVSLLAKRRVCVMEVGKFKKKNGLKIYQPARERELLVEKAKLAEKAGVDPDLIKKFFGLILKNSRKIQREIHKAKL